MKVWEYIWMNAVKTEDETINKAEVMEKRDGEKIIKDSLRNHFGFHLCLSGLYEKVPEEVREWWVNTPTPCMMKKEKRMCDNCWEGFLDRRVGGFVPLVIKGGRVGGRNGNNKFKRL